MLTFPGFGNPAGTPETRNAARAKMGVLPPAGRAHSIRRGGDGTIPPSAAEIEAEEMAKRRKEMAARASRSATILTSPSGVLGDPPLDRPAARSATVLG